MKRMKLAAVLMMLVIGVAWVSAAAAQRATVGGPVTAVPRTEKAPAQFRPERFEGGDAPATGFDTRRPDAGAGAGEEGPSKAFYEEQEGGRRRH